MIEIQTRFFNPEGQDGRGEWTPWVTSGNDYDFTTVEEAIEQAQDAEALQTAHYITGKARRPYRVVQNGEVKWQSSNQRSK